MFASPAVNFHSKVFPSSLAEERVISLRVRVTLSLLYPPPSPERVLRHTLSFSPFRALFNHDNDGDDEDKKLPLSPETTHFEITFLAPSLPAPSFRGAARQGDLTVL